MFKHTLPLLLLMVGCTSNTSLNKPINFDYTAVENIEFKLQSLPGNKSDLSDFDWTKSVSLEISERFAKAGYPISSSYDNSTTTVTHVLDVEVEASRITDVQPGFSLGFGNSNPRSTNFQKTLSAPILCKIRSVQDPDQNVSLKELKSVSSPMDNIAMSRQKKSEKLKQFYIENVGSTCHNLLKKLSVKPSLAANPDVAIDETFAPAMRIETKYKSNKAQDLKIEPAKKIKQQKEVQAVHEVQGTQEIQEVQEIKVMNESLNKTVEKENTYNITTEKKNTQDWRDAEMTIFNQGDTVILEFGNNRR